MRALSLAPGHQDDPVGAHDRVDAHRDGHLGRVLQSEEGARLDLARVVGELHQTGARACVGAGLVESDLSVLADADDHQVDLACRLIVGGAVFRYLVFGDRTVGNVDILGQDVDVVEELLVDAVVAALLLGRLDRVELVEAEDGDVAEADLSGLVAADQFVVESQRGAAGGQTQHEGLHLVVDAVRRVGLLVVADRLDNGVSHVLYAEILVFVDVRADLFVAMDDVARGRFRNQAPVFRK